MTKTAAVPADDGFYVILPRFGPNNINMLDFVPVIAWCIEGPNIDDDRIIPVTEDTEIEPDDVYALQYPDGSFHFPDGEHVTGDDALLASFRRRCAWRNAP